ncbi:MAG: tetratricopeptide repeat protein [Salibacteraceae bacterium]
MNSHLFPRPFLCLVLWTVLIFPVQSQPVSAVDSLTAQLWRPLDDTVRVQVLLRLCEHHAQQLDAAQRYGEEALRLAQRHHLTEARVAAHRYLGKAYGNRGAVESSRAHYLLAIEILRQEEAEAQVGWLFHQLGSMYASVGDLVEALRYYQLALESGEQSRENAIVAQAYQHLGNILRDQGKYTEAREHFVHAFHIRRNLGDPKRAVLLFNLSSVYLKQQQWDSALWAIDSGRALAELLDQEMLLRQLNINRAVVMAQRGQLNQAAITLENAFKWMEQSGNTWNQVECGHHLVAVYLKQNRYPMAQVVLQKCKSINRHLKHPQQVQTQLELCLQLYEQTGALGKSLDAARQLLSIKDATIANLKAKHFDAVAFQPNVVEKEQSIDQLEAEHAQLEAQTAKAARVVGLGGAIVLLLILLGKWQHRSKRNLLERHPIFETVVQRANPTASGSATGLEPTRFSAISALRLTRRELEILELIAQGKTNKSIASELYISQNTTKTHLSNIYSKLAVANRTQAAEKARFLQLV